MAWVDCMAYAIDTTIYFPLEEKVQLESIPPSQLQCAISNLTPVMQPQTLWLPLYNSHQFSSRIHFHSASIAPEQVNESVKPLLPDKLKPDARTTHGMYRTLASVSIESTTSSGKIPATFVAYTPRT